MIFGVGIGSSYVGGRKKSRRLNRRVADGGRSNLVTAKIEYARVQSAVADDTSRIAGTTTRGVPSCAGGHASCNCLLHQNRIRWDCVQYPDHVRTMRSHVVQFNYNVFGKLALDTKVPVLAPWHPDI